MKNEAVLSFLKALRKKPLPLLLAFLGVLLLVIGGISARDEAKTEVREEDTNALYREMLEKELTALLGEVRGVGKLSVMVTLEAGEKNTYSGSKLTQTEMPRVCGVAVVCAGGGRESVRAEIASLLSSLLGIGTHRIHVSEKRA